MVVAEARGYHRVEHHQAGAAEVEFGLLGEEFGALGAHRLRFKESQIQVLR